MDTLKLTKAASGYCLLGHLSEEAKVGIKFYAKDRKAQADLTNEIVKTYEVGMCIFSLKA